MLGSVGGVGGTVGGGGVGGGSGEGVGHGGGYGGVGRCCWRGGRVVWLLVILEGIWGAKRDGEGGHDGLLGFGMR